MSEGAMTRGAAETRLQARARKDPGFRALLQSNPKEAIQQEIGRPLPENLDVTVLTEDPRHIYLVLPADAAASSELSDDELDAGSRGVLQHALFLELYATVNLVYDSRFTEPWE